MVLSIIIALNAAPGLLGTQEAIRQGQAKEKREEHRGRRCNLMVRCIKSSSRNHEIDGRRIVLWNNSLYIDPGLEKPAGRGHPFAGYYLPYPDEDYEGLVSTITDEAPILNWIYIHAETFEVKYGVRADAQLHLHGPWDCTRQDRRLTFEGWEGFCVVEDFTGHWALYFDHDDDGLRCKAQQGYRVLEVELVRTETRWCKDPATRKTAQGSGQHSSESTQHVEAQKSQLPVKYVNKSLQRLSQPEEIPLPLSPTGGIAGQHCSKS